MKIGDILFKSLQRATYFVLVAILSLLLLLASACGAPDTGTPEPSPLSEHAPDKSFIWRVSSNYNSIYLLGSIHVGSSEIYPLDSSIENAFDMADNLVVEVNTEEIDEAEAMELLFEHATYPEDGGLKDSLPEDLYAQLDEQFGQWGISLALLDRYRPWFISMTLELLTMQNMGYLTEYGIDLYFLKKAIESGKDIIELETDEFQLELLSSIPDELMILVLEIYIEEPLTQEEADRLFELWERGDADEVESLLFESMTEEPALMPYYEAVFDERNFRMAEKIEEFFLDDEIYFIVVGAGHLVGENGLINILDERGYEIEQLLDSDQ